MIQSSPEGGIVAIPSNCNSWPYNYRDHAEKLMAMRCPGGYDIVGEQEVIVGQKLPTNPNVKVVPPPGSVTAPLDQLPTSGSALTRSLTVTTMKEYWITFRDRTPMPIATANGVTAP